ncbi:TPA: hypothetical protein DEP94_02690 [Candidatus Nomurabacteria bacterium]|nr:hypothetical protein [Candidatus Nomurabacteria bacterium]
MSNTKVAVVTVTYGKRWDFLSQVINSVINDVHVVKFIIVDNGSRNQKEIEDGVKIYGEKVLIIRHDKNLGSAGGFHAGLKAVRDIDCDFVFLLDDDNVPEVGAIDRFLDIKKNFLKGDKIVLMGNRVDLSGSQEYFYKPSLRDLNPKGTFFEVFSFEKVINFIKLVSDINNKRSGPFLPIIPTIGFIYGGAFLPITAVCEAPLPDKSLVLYGDDIAYSWGVKKAGYKSYVSTSPVIHDIDSSFGDSHIFGLFNPSTRPFKVYYRIRNMVRISRENSPQWKITLLLSIFIWILGLCILGIFKYGITWKYFERVKLIIEAVYGGYVKSAGIPMKAELPQ